MAIDTNNFFKSKDVKAFPCSYRGNYGGSTFDPESRLNTEYNFTHLGGANESYVIDYNAAEQILRLVIGGYYFEISNVAAYGLSGKYLSIGTKTVALKESDGTDSDRTTRVLASRSGTSADLDEQQGGEYYFTGIFIGNEPTGEAYLKAFSNYPEIYQPSLRPAIKRGEGAKSTLLGGAGEASGNSSHAEGSGTAASGDYSHAEGHGAAASGACAHAEGKETAASGECSHAEGYGAKASGGYSHAEGHGTKASGIHSHAEGDATEASGGRAHAEGYNAKAPGDSSHAEGSDTKASGTCAHAGGSHTIASRDNQTAIGEYNKEEDGEFIIGVGTGEENRNNALVVNGLKTMVKNTFAVIGDVAATFFTGPDKTEIATKTNSISGDTNAIKGAANTITGATNTITGATAIVAEDKDKESKETKIAVDDNEITLQDTDDSYIKINRGGANRNTKQVELSSTNINSAASSANSVSGKEIIIGGTGADGVIGAKIDGAEKITVNASSTTISNDAVNINGATAIKQSDANKIEVTADGTKITSGKTAITNGKNGRGIEIKVSDQGTQINVDGNDLFGKWIKEYVLDAAYPVGSIYTYLPNPKPNGTYPTISECPIAVTLGGTWERIKGEFLYAAETTAVPSMTFKYGAGKTGGSKDAVVVSHTHDLETNAAVTVKENKTLTGWFDTLKKRNDSYNLSEIITRTSDKHVAYKIDGGDAKDGYGCFVSGVINNRHNRLHLDFNHGHECEVTQPTIATAGESGVGKNMPPFLCVYMWKRVK